MRELNVPSFFLFIFIEVIIINDNNLNQQVSKFLTQPTINLTAESLDKYRKKFQFLLNEISLLEGEQESVLGRLQTLTYTNERLSKMDSKTLAREMLKNRNKNQVDLIFQQSTQLLDRLESYYKQSYEIINKFREEFFMPITYSYGFTHGGQTYSISGLTFKDISSLISLDVATKTNELNNLYKLRFNPTKAALKNLIEAHQDKLINLTETNEKGSTVWSTLNKYRKKYNQTDSKFKVNKGQFYEVYRSVLNENDIDNGPPSPFLSEEYVLSKFIEIRKNNLSWVRGGDIDTEQDKFGRASVTSAKTLIETLRELIMILDPNDLNRENIAKKIAVVFGNQRFDKTVKDEAMELALKELQEEILSKFVLTK